MKKPKHNELYEIRKQKGLTIENVIEWLTVPRYGNYPCPVTVATYWKWEQYCPERYKKIVLEHLNGLSRTDFVQKKRGRPLKKNKSIVV